GASFSVTGSGNMTITNGTGSSSMTFNPTGSCTIGGKLTVTATDGDDLLTLLHVSVTGATSINTGNGVDDITIGSSTFSGLASIVLGAGADSLAIEDASSNDGVTTVFNAAVKIDTGNGDDQVHIGVVGDTNDFGDFKAAVTITGGLDLDIILALSNAANT